MKWNIIFGDITANCNIRCKFCSTDWATAKLGRPMTDETYLRFLEVGSTQADEYSLSCGMEAMIHPRFAEFVGRVPTVGFAFITTNLARVLPEFDIASLVESNVKRVQVSLESLRRESYEFYRAGAKYEVFVNNLTRLTTALHGRGAGAPVLRSMTLAFRENRAEIPSLLRRLRDEFGFTQHDLRTPFTFSRAYISAGFVDRAGYLTRAEFSDLGAEVKRAFPDVILNDGESEGYDGRGQLLAWVSADGGVYFQDGSLTNLAMMDDPADFFQRKATALTEEKNDPLSVVAIAVHAGAGEGR